MAPLWMSIWVRHPAHGTAGGAPRRVKADPPEFGSRNRKHCFDARRGTMRLVMGLMEILIIVFVVVVIFGGGSQLPRLGSAIGKSIINFKKAISGQNPDEIDVTPKKEPDEIPARDDRRR